MKKIGIGDTTQYGEIMGMIENAKRVEFELETEMTVVMLFGKMNKENIPPNYVFQPETNDVRIIKIIPSETETALEIFEMINKDKKLTTKTKINFF